MPLAPAGKTSTALSPRRVVGAALRTRAEQGQGVSLGVGVSEVQAGGKQSDAAEQGGERRVSSQGGGSSFTGSAAQGQAGPSAVINASEGQREQAAGHQQATGTGSDGGEREAAAHAGGGEGSGEGGEDPQAPSVPYMTYKAKLRAVRGARKSAAFVDTTVCREVTDGDHGLGAPVSVRTRVLRPLGAHASLVTHNVGGVCARSHDVVCAS